MFTNDRAKLVANLRGEEIKVWDLVSGAPPRTLPIATRWVVAAAGEHILTTDNRELVSVWNLASGDRVETFRPAINWHVMDAAFSPDGRLLAIGMEPIPELYPYDECRQTTVLSPVGSSDDRRQLKGDLPRNAPGAVGLVAFSADGAQLASMSNWEDTAELWDVATGERRRDLERGYGVHAAVFSPDGWSFVSGEEDGEMLIWNLASDPGPKNRPYRLREAGSAVTALAYSADGALLASGHADGVIELWEMLPVVRPFLTLPTPSGSVLFLSFVADTWSLAAEYEGRWVQIWDAVNGAVASGFDPTA
jgi:WD40 repeat protein